MRKKEKTLLPASFNSYFLDRHFYRCTSMPDFMLKIIQTELRRRRRRRQLSMTLDIPLDFLQTKRTETKVGSTFNNTTQQHKVFAFDQRRQRNLSSFADIRIASVPQRTVHSGAKTQLLHRYST